MKNTLTWWWYQMDEQAIAEPVPRSVAQEVRRRAIELGLVNPEDITRKEVKEAPQTPDI